MKGFAGTILNVDLSDEMILKENVEPDSVRDYIGGKGYAARLLWERTPEGVDPLEPENLVIFATGPLTGTLCPATRMCVVTKSPLTGTYNDSYVGGHFGNELKFAGYDYLIVRGKAEAPVYLWMDDENVEIRDAKWLWGKDTFETEERLKDRHEDRTIRVACIGPAGERLVRYASVNVDLYRQAARGGIGAVMGAKNLKAIAVRGTRCVEMENPDRFDQLASESYNAIETNEGLYTMKRWGTGRSVLFSSDQSLYPTRNYQSETFEGAENLSGESMDRRIWVKRKACFNCPIHCGHLAAVRSKKYQGAIVEGIEYETTALLGADCGVDDLGAVTNANMLCDRLGLDTLSTGSSIAFAMECFEKGILTEKDTSGIRLKFGNHEAMNEMIVKIAERKGLGDLLAEGVKIASEKIGKHSGRFAMHVKGLELPGWGIRGAPSMGLAYATADRGGCHQRAWPISYELGSRTPDGKLSERYNPEGKALGTKYDQDLGAALYSLIACDFSTGAIGTQRYIDLLNAETGWTFDQNTFMETGERIWNLIRAFNIREGITKKDDTLPPRIFEDPLPVGIAKGRVLPKEDFERMLKEYYELREWNLNSGIPTYEKLKKLRLEDVAERLMKIA
jgi:aldehyde:ferredoxin oxidoreductase